MQIDIDSSDMEKQMKKMKHIKNNTPKVFTKAVNGTVSSMKTYTKTAVSKIYAVDKKYVGDRIVAKKINSDLGGGYIVSTHAPTFINRFEHTENVSPGKRGGAYVSAKVKRDRGSKEIKGAFVATIKNKNGSGNVGVFIRTNRTREDNGKQILQGIYRPGVASMMNNEDVSETVMKKAHLRFEKALDKSINKELEVAKK